MTDQPITSGSASVVTAAADPYDPGWVRLRFGDEGHDPVEAAAFPVWAWNFTAGCWNFLTEAPAAWSRYATTDHVHARSLIRFRAASPLAPAKEERRTRRRELLEELAADGGPDLPLGAARWSSGAYAKLVATFEDWYLFAPDRADDAAFALWSGYEAGAFTTAAAADGANDLAEGE